MTSVMNKYDLASTSTLLPCCLPPQSPSCQSAPPSFSFESKKRLEEGTCRKRDMWAFGEEKDLLCACDMSPVK